MSFVTKQIGNLLRNPKGNWFFAVAKLVLDFQQEVHGPRPPSMILLSWWLWAPSYPVLPARIRGSSFLTGPEGPCNSTARDTLLVHTGIVTKNIPFPCITYVVAKNEALVSCEVNYLKMILRKVTKRCFVWQQLTTSQTVECALIWKRLHREMIPYVSPMKL